MVPRLESGVKSTFDSSCKISKVKRRFDPLFKVLDDKTLGFADFTGNKQYITLGNLSENPKAFIFLMDYAHSRRVKLWGSAHAVEDDPTLLDQLRDLSYPGEVERVSGTPIKL